LGIEVVKRVNKADALRFRVTVAERAELDRWASSEGLTKSLLIRKALAWYKEKGPAELEARNGAGSADDR
jgi:hypothetical protein